MISTPLRDRLERTGLRSDDDPLKPVLLAPTPSDNGDSAPDDAVLDDDAIPHKRGTAVVKEIVETVLFVLLVFFIVRGLVQNFRIEGSSMFPTMHDKQYILVNKAVYMNFDLNAPLRLLPGKGDLPTKTVYPFHPAQRGDIVVFLAPESAHDSPDKDYIKRVIATAGETVTITEGKVYVNDKLLDESSYFTTPIDTTCEGFQAICTATVTPGHVFVMGDNRPNSSDSRKWGPLPLENVIGKAWLSYWPKADWGVIPAPSYAQQ